MRWRCLPYQVTSFPEGISHVNWYLWVEPDASTGSKVQRKLRERLEGPHSVHKLEMQASTIIKRLQLLRESHSWKLIAEITA